MRQRNEHAKRFGRWSCAKRLRRPARRGRILAPPDAGNISGRILKRSTRTDCKSVGYAFVGSNPTSPTERIKHGRLWRACFIRSVSEGGSAAPIRVRHAPHKACTASHPDRAYPHPPQPFSSIDKSADPTSPSPLMSALASGDPQAPSSAARSRLLTAPSPLRSLPEDGTRIA